MDDYMNLPNKGAKPADDYMALPSKVAKEYQPPEGFAEPFGAPNALMGSPDVSLKDIGKAAYLSTKQQIPMLEKGFQATPQQALINLATGGLKKETKALAKPEKEEQKISKQLEQIQPGERMLGMALSPYAEAGALKGLSTTAKLGKQALGAVGEALPRPFKAPEPVANPRSLDDLGREFETTVAKKINKDYEARSKQANQDYDAALKEARQKQKIQPFAESPQGKALLQSLERDKYVISNGKLLEKGADQIKGINELQNAIRGTVKPSEEISIAGGQLKAAKPGRLTKTIPATTRQKDVTALIEELRYLRDKSPVGKPAEKYGALSNEYRNQLIKKLERSLYDWNPKYEIADARYKASSDQLNKYKTQFMANATKGEKFDISQFAKDTESLPGTFFDSADTVRQLKTVLNDDKLINRLGKEYIATIFENKTPEQMKLYAFDPKNVGWMKESGVLKDIQNYANRAKTIADRKTIAKNIGLIGAASAIGTKGAKILGIF